MSKAGDGSAGSPGIFLLGRSGDGKRIHHRFGFYLMADQQTFRQTPRKRFIAGVDPGRSTGIGVFDRDQDRITYLATTDFFGVAPWFMRMTRIADLKVFVEVPALFMYDRSNAKADKVRDRYMANCGEVKREAQLLAELLRREGFLVEEIAPIREKKWTQEQFRMATRLSRQANQHERDAARIALVYANKREMVKVR